MKKQWSFISRIAIICMAFLLVALNAVTLVSCSKSEKTCKKIRNYKCTSEEDFINLALNYLPNWSLFYDLDISEYDYVHDKLGGDINYKQDLAESLDGYESYKEYKSGTVLRICVGLRVCDSSAVTSQREGKRFLASAVSIVGFQS